MNLNKPNSQARSILKTITWRVLATVITGIVVYLFTGEFGQSTKITLTAAAVLAMAYYLHERLWVRMRNR